MTGFSRGTLLALILAAIPAAVSSAPAHQQLDRLDGPAILRALAGHFISYAPPHSFDAGAHEEFHADGGWRGIRYSRGPIPFAGRWTIDDGKLCVAATSGMFAEAWQGRPHCRPLWRDPASGALLIEHVSPSPSFGLQHLRVELLPPGR